MQLFLEIIEGDRQGARFQLKAGMSVGRKNADILLRDSKVSGRHAFVEERAGGRLFLVDNQSSNGIKIDGARVREVELTPGTILQIGRSLLRVLAPDFSTNETATEALVPEKESWRSTVAQLAEAAQSRAKTDPIPLSAFNPLVCLKFTHGLQAGLEWTLGYGPREIGREGLDYQIEEPNCPAICFALIPHRKGPIFQTEHPETVKLNGRAIGSESLDDGDVIEINNTRITVILMPEVRPDE